jgi:integrase
MTYWLNKLKPFLRSIKMNDLQLLEQHDLTVKQNKLQNRAIELIAKADSPNTIRAKASDLKQFNAWLNTQESPTVDAGRFIEYLSYLSLNGYAYASIQRSKTYILSQSNIDFTSEQLKLLKAFMRGLAKEIGTKQHKAHALTLDELLSMIDELPHNQTRPRNKAMLTLGWACALRVSELIALTVDDIHKLDSHNFTVHIARSKTDQTGKGQSIAVIQGRNLTPLDDLKAWIRKADLKGTDKLFNITAGVFNKMMKNLARKARIEGDVSCHSLRAGGITAMATAGATLDKIKEVSRHKSTNILLGYIRDGDKFKNNATAKVL